MTGNSDDITILTPVLGLQVSASALSIVLPFSAHFFSCVVLAPSPFHINPHVLHSTNGLFHPLLTSLFRSFHLTFITSISTHSFTPKGFHTTTSSCYEKKSKNSSEFIDLTYGSAMADLPYCLCGCWLQWLLS